MRVASWCVVGLALVLTACGKATAPGHDLVFLSTPTGVIGIDAASGATVLDAAYAVPTGDWSRVVSGRLEGTTSRILVDDVSTGATTEVARTPGALVPRVISRNGNLVALGDAWRSGGARWDPVPRANTSIAVLDIAGGESRRYSLAGNFEPEAFTTDDRTLVLIEYVPATKPERYRLNELDLATGNVFPLGQRIKRFAPEEMRGTGRTHVAAPDGSALYTLYTRQGPNLTHTLPGANLASATVHAFVHVLNLDKGWAHCVDLPDGFGTRGAALTVSPDGGRLFAFDGKTIAMVNTRTLAVVGIARPEVKPNAGPVAAEAAPDGSLLVASGSEIVRFDGSALSIMHRYKVPAIATGIGVSADGARLYVTIEHAVMTLDAVTGADGGTFEVPGSASGLVSVLRVIRRPSPS